MVEEARLEQRAEGLTAVTEGWFVVNVRDAAWVHNDVLGDTVGYLTEGMVIEALYYQGWVVGIEMPIFVELAVKETTPNIKGAAVQNTSKPAILETGLEIKVPPYIEQGNRVKIDTRTGQFVERA